MAIQGTARKGRKEFLIKAMIGMVIPIYAGYVLGQYMPLSKLLDSELTISSLIPSMGNITQYTKGAVSLCFMAYMILVLKLYDPKHYRGEPNKARLNGEAGVNLRNIAIKKSLDTNLPNGRCRTESL